jgi:hypothetical protein
MLGQVEKKPDNRGDEGMLETNNRSDRKSEGVSKIIYHQKDERER